MSKRTATLIAWSLAGLSLALLAAIVALYIPTRSVYVPSRWGTGGDSAILIFWLPFLAFPIVGALIASRHPKNTIGWICLASGIFWMLGGASTTYGQYGLLVARPGSVPFAAEIGLQGEWLWVPTAGLVGIYLLLLFPDGRLPSRRWRALAWLSGAVIILVSAGVALAPRTLPNLGGIHNPFGLEGHRWVADALNGVILLFTLCILASAVSLVLRYRRSGGEVRQQIKWIAFAASLVSVAFLVAVISALIVAPDTMGTGGTQPLWLQLLQDAVQMSNAGIAVAVGFAILKYRLYDIEVVINRTLVYGSLTAILATFYFGSVVTLQYLFSLLTGQGNTLAIVASTLAIAALSMPLRRRIQGFIDRRFYRRKYDARKTLEAFGTKLRDQTDLERISEDLAEVVNETMQPAHLSVILRSEVPSSTTTKEQGQQEDQQTTRHEED